MINDEKMAEVARLVRKAQELGLEGADDLSRYTLEDLASRYNGVGPESFPERWRAAITKSLPTFLPAVLLHDVDFSNSDGTREGWQKANNRFVRNCRACAKGKYAWWSWKRYWDYILSEVLYGFVSTPAGYKAWLEEYRKHKTERKAK
jgi:hypothetical protein